MAGGSRGGRGAAVGQAEVVVRPAAEGEAAREHRRPGGGGGRLGQAGAGATTAMWRRRRREEQAEEPRAREGPPWQGLVGHK